MREYIVQIPVRPNLLAGVGASSGDGLPDGYEFYGLLRTRMGPGSLIPTWYLDFNVQAEDARNAISKVLPTAYCFVQFVALVYDRGFEVDIVDSTAKRVDGGTEATDHVHMASSPANLDEMAALWDQYDKIGDKDKKEHERKDLIRQGLDWIHLGKTMRDPRNRFLAYITALEILLDHEQAGTVLKTSLAEKVRKKLGNVLAQHIKDAEQCERVLEGIVQTKYEEVRNKLRKQIGDVLKPYIEDEGLRGRVINYMTGAEVEGKAARWKRVLDAAKVPATKKELGEIYNARSSTTHSGSSGEALPIQRAHEIATSYIKALISQ